MPVDTAELEAFLAGRYVATMATYRADGTAHLTANWYLYEDGAIYLPTSSRTVKARHVLRDPRCSVMVDSRGPAPMRGGGTSGPASVITGAEAAALNERTWLRYLTPAGLDDPAVGGLLKAYETCRSASSAASGPGGTWGRCSATGSSRRTCRSASRPRGLRAGSAGLTGALVAARCGGVRGRGLAAGGGRGAESP